MAIRKPSPTPKPHHKRKYGLTTFIQKYFVEHPGLIVFAEDLSAEGQWPLSSIQAAVTRLMVEGRLDGLEVSTRGRAWVYRPNNKVVESPKSSKRVFEELATTKSGKLLLQDETGVVYEATEL